ncbi:hydroxyacid dehydrogenase [Siccirubricoccus sp. G192]|uniref:hydroxyacid dehydrogenase n=1 Tax=Siccirubricoccus sp. G192 TaxID=2849651 RepID=UPI001C2CA451|nr:hydroxyacid dehydrogenase [Siccirubricoccus sp. G192]MBV1799537.1 hydroxyacid dehydrogenase [Siccirubricoccus sp. G192]
MTHRVLLCRRLHPAGMALLEARADLDIVALHDPPVEESHQHLSSAEAVLCWLERLDQAALATAPRLRVVSRYGVGFDTVDIAACTARGIPVMVVNGTNDLSVAEHAMMLMLAVARRAVDADRHVKTGGWWFPGGPDMVDLAGRSVLVVGHGRIGSRVARYCRAFDMRVLVFDPLYHPARIAADGYQPVRDFHAALAEADVVTLHCPLSPQTRHLMDAAAFAALKPGAILVNTARGPLVSQAALAEALRSGRLFGAGLDVLEAEPSEAANPLFELPNVVVSPHNAASTEEGLARMARQAARNILDALDGKPDPAMMVNAEVLRQVGFTLS